MNIYDYGHTPVHRNTKKKKKCLWKKWDKRLEDMIEKGKKYSIEEISPFPTVFFKEEIDLAIHQEIGLLQQLQFSAVSLFAV